MTSPGRAAWWPEPKTRLGQWLEVSAVPGAVGYGLGCLFGGLVGLTWAASNAGRSPLWDVAEAVLLPPTVLALVGAAFFGGTAAAGVGLFMTWDWAWGLFWPTNKR